MYKFERYRQLGLADFNQPTWLRINRKTFGLKKLRPFMEKLIEQFNVGRYEAAVKL